MRTLLRHMPTGLYFQNLDQWTDKREQAFDFKSIQRALRLVRGAGFEEMELVLCREESRQAGLPRMVVRYEAYNPRVGLAGAAMWQ